jgi:hypothetical protein
MGVAKKRTLMFQTPRKKTMTPIKSTSHNVVSPNKEIKKTATASKPKAEKIKTLENELIQAYREENNFLRNLKNEVLLYNKLLGITIKEEKNIINFSIERDSSTGHKKLKFNLEEKEDIFIFTLETEENCSVPEYFYDVIEFEKKAFPLFFYKAMQAVYETRSNE